MSKVSKYQKNVVLSKQQITFEMGRLKEITSMIKRVLITINLAQELSPGQVKVELYDSDTILRIALDMSRGHYTTRHT